MSTTAVQPHVYLTSADVYAAKSSSSTEVVDNGSGLPRLAPSAPIGKSMSAAPPLDLHREQDRLSTFAEWPVAFIQPAELARNGFYYTHQTDVVRCAFCNVEIGRWEEGDNVANDHRRWSSSCPFLCGQNVGNQPLGGGVEHHLEPAALAANGNGTAANSQDTCGRYGIQLRPNSVPEKSEVTSLSRLGVSVNRDPVYALHSTFDSRLKTFSEWPRCMKQKADDLAAAGFFYTGKGDQTLCFSCGGGLKDWEENDDPWEQHAKWFPKCSFVLMSKGHDFVADVCSREQPVLTREQVEELQPSASTSSAASEEEKRLLEVVKFREHKGAAQNSPVVDTQRQLEQQEQQEQAASKGTDEARMCKICYQEELGVVFLPCGHIVACVKCAPSLNLCAVCRQPFTATVRAFLS